MINAIKNITVMIYLIFVQDMKHGTQITQGCREYDSTTNSIKFRQQTTSSLSDAVHLPDK